MNSSDIIAIIAISISAVVSIATSIIGLLTNNTNIKARRSEIALERRLKAFQDLVEKCAHIQKLIIDENEANTNDIRAQLIQANRILLDTYMANIIFLPPNISALLRYYGKESSVYIQDEKYNAEKNHHYFETISHCETEIINSMQKFIGYT